MKKGFAILFLCLLLFPLFLNLLSSQEAVPDIPSGLTPEQIEDTTGKFSAQFNYLAKEWRNILMANPTVKSIDSFLQKINIIFVIIFGTDYSLSIPLLITILLWIYFFILFSKIFRNFASFKKWISSIIALLITVVLAQIKLIKVQVDFIMWLLFSDKPWWMRLIFGVLAIAILIVVFILLDKFGKLASINRQKMKDLENRMNLETASKSGLPLVEALSKLAKEE